LVIKALDPDWIRIRIGVHPKMLDPDPDEINADPQPWLTFYLIMSSVADTWRCLLLFEGSFTSFFKDKTSKRSHGTTGFKVFLTIFA
jgi:hypothetical protein